MVGETATEIMQAENVDHFLKLLLEISPFYCPRNVTGQLLVLKFPIIKIKLRAANHEASGKR